MAEDHPSELAIVRQLDADRAQGLHPSAPLVGVSFGLVDQWESGVTDPPEERLVQWLEVLELPLARAAERSDRRAVEQIGRILAERGLDDDGCQQVMRVAHNELALRARGQPDSRRAASS